MIILQTAKTLFAGLLTVLLLTLSLNTLANPLIVGVWKTESTERGYLHVDVKLCDDQVCGTILNAFNTADELINDYEHVGKPIIWDMQVRGENSWNKGKIWDPSSDKTYKSKMSVNGDTLSVSGCVAIFCKAQDWTRVE